MDRYRTRVAAAILSGTPLMPALLRALTGRRAERPLSPAPYVPAPPRSREAG